MKALAAFRALAAREAGVAWRGGEGAIDRGLSAAAFLAAALLLWLRVEGHPESARAFAAREEAGWIFRWTLVAAGALAPLGFVRLLSRDRERGVLDLLLLSPVPSAALLFAKTAGRAAGYAAALAAGLPGLLVLLPLGGVSFGELVSLLGIVFGFVLACGGLSAFFSSLFRGATGAMGAAWSVAALWVGGPRLFMRLGADPAVVAASEAISFGAHVDRELKGVFPDPTSSFSALAAGAGVLLAGCLAGGLLLRRRHATGRSTGLLQRAVAAIRGRASAASAAPRWAKLFRPLVPSRHPLVRREALVGRDFAFRLGWLAFAFVSGLVALGFLFGADLRHYTDHLYVAAGGFAAALAIAALHGVVAFGSARRRGLLEVYLSSNVEPEEILRARSAAVSLRALFLALPWAAYLATATALFEPSGQTLSVTGMALVGAGLAIVAVGVTTLSAAVAFRRTVLAGAAALLGVPAVFGAGVVAASGWPGALLFAPLCAGILMVTQARTASRFRTRILR